MGKERRTLVYGELNADKPSKAWKVLAILFAFTSVLLLSGIVFLLLRKGKAKTTNSPESPDQCPNYLKVDTKLRNKNPGVFQDLTSYELKKVQEFMQSQVSLNLTLPNKAALTDNFIVYIENYPPPKSEVISFLDEGGSKPARTAKVIIMHGAERPPFVGEYLVKSLPSPRTFEKLDIYGYPDGIPFSERPMTNQERNLFISFFTTLKPKIKEILLQSFDADLFSESDRSLTIAFSGIGAEGNESNRMSWISFLRDVPGRYLNILPLQFLVDHTSNYASKWKIRKVVYHEQEATNIEDFIKGYMNGTIRKIQLPWPSPDLLDAASLQKQKSNYLFQKPGRGPAITDTTGRRFGIVGRLVQYSNWEFEIGSSTFTGMSVFNVKYRHVRVAYEMSIQETVSIFSSYFSGSTVNIGSRFGFVSKNPELIPQIDCPEDSVYLEMTTCCSDGAVKVFPKAVCLFETNLGVPERRHMERRRNSDGMQYYGGHSSYALVVRSAITVANTDYIIDFTFHQSGLIELQTAVTGYPFTVFYTENEAPFGFKIFSNTLAPTVDHFVLYKVDLDVAGTVNSYETLQLVAKKQSSSSKSQRDSLQRTLLRTLKRNENEAILKYEAVESTRHIVFNERANNSFGMPRGYQVILDGTIKQQYARNDTAITNIAWTKYPLAVSKYNDNERSGSSIYNQFGYNKPVMNFEKILDGNDDIDMQDLVFWLAPGFTQIPTTDNIPIYSTRQNTFGLKLQPFGFFDKDPTMYSRESVLIEHLNGTNYKTYNYGTPTQATCKIKKRDINFNRRSP